MMGQYCSLYKECKMCGRTKWYKEFPSKGYRRRRAYCRECKQLYIFDVSRLKVSDIIVQIKVFSNRKIRYKVKYEEAKQLIEEGMAGIVHETLIHQFYSKQSFRKKILERDNHTCVYCGQHGNTIDHVVPLSKGGRSTFKNCVCACMKCNLGKGNLSLEEYLLLNRTDLL